MKKLSLLIISLMLPAFAFSADPYVNIQRDNLLITAARNGKINEVKNLLTQGANINATGPVFLSYPPQGGHTVLMNAILGHKDRDNRPVISLLLQRGADKNKTNAMKQNSVEFTQKSALSRKKKKEVLNLLK